MFEQELQDLVPLINKKLCKGFDITIKKLKDGIKIQYFRPHKLGK